MRLRDLPRDRSVQAYILLILAIFYRPLANETFFFRDLYLLFYPKKLLLAEVIRAGHVPLWDSLTHGGLPYLVLPPNFAFHPSNVLYLVLPPIFAFNLVIVLHIFFCAVAAYWLARTIGLSSPSAFVAGVVYALCGYTLSTANLLPLLLGTPWIPMTIGLAHRALRDRRSFVPAAIAAAMPLFSAAVELTAMLFAILIVWVVFVRLEVSRGRRAIAIAIVIAGAIGLSLVQTLPATSVIAQSRRAEARSYESFTHWSVAPQRLPELAIPRFFGNTNVLRDQGYWGRNFESLGFPYILSFYFGIPALLLAVAALAKRTVPLEAPRVALAVIAIVAIVLSFGRHLPLFRLIYDYVPLVTIFRYPVKAIIAALLPIALLTGCGAEELLHSRPLQRSLAIAAAIFTVIPGAIALTGNVDAIARWFSFMPLDAGNRTDLARAFGHAALAAAAFAIAAIVAARDARAIAVVVTLDLAIASLAVNHFAPRSVFDEPPIAATVRQHAGGMRFYSSERDLALWAPEDDLRYLAAWQIRTLNGYTASMFGIPVVFHIDYDGLAPARISHLGSVMRRLPWERRRALLDRAGVRVFLAQTEVVLPDVVEVARMPAPRAPLRLYVNEHAMLARFVSSVDVARDDRDALRRTVLARDLSRVVITGTPPSAGDCGSALVRVVERSSAHARYEVDAPCDGLAVLAENHYDGWRATVDGREVAHVRADYAFTAVPVSRGKHVIERRYTPPRLWLGAGGSVLTLIALGGGSLLRRRRNRVTS